jgi:hypothetical protein
MRRHRDALVHREMCHGLTSAIVANFSLCPPEKPAEWTDFAINYIASHRQSSQRSSELSEAQKQMIHAHNLRVLEMSARMKEEQANGQ